MEKNLLKILYIAPEQMLKPYFDDLCLVAADEFDISLFTSSKSVEAQLHGIDLVIEHGGAYSTVDMLDAGVKAGVKLWQVTATGLDHVNVDLFLERGIPLANMPGPISTAIPMAEHALFMMLALSKRLYSSQKSFKDRVLNVPMTSELYGKTIGLIGLGASGKEVAKRCNALGMQVMAIDSVDIPSRLLDNLKLSFFGDTGYTEKIFSECDYISLHIPLMTSTRQFVNRHCLSLMKRSAFLVNVSRGELIDEAALIDAIVGEKIAGAGLDALCNEPVDPSHPLLHHENVIVTPHNGVVTRELSLRRAKAATDQARRIIGGQTPLYLVKKSP